MCKPQERWLRQLAHAKWQQVANPGSLQGGFIMEVVPTTIEHVHTGVYVMAFMNLLLHDIPCFLWGGILGQDGNALRVRAALAVLRDRPMEFHRRSV
jgi:hypothetical protein